MRTEMAGKSYKSRRIWWGALLFGLIAALALALNPRAGFAASQGTGFRLDIDSLRMSTGVSGSLTVSLVNAQDAEVVAFSGLEAFDILSVSSSSSTVMSGGVTNYQLDLYYIIMPRAAGTYTVSATIRYNGQLYQTNALEVTVSDAGSGGGAPDLFVETVVSHEMAYLGEKLVLSYELYARVSVASFNFADYGAIDGVVAMDVTDEQIQAESVYVDGVHYNKYTIARMILDPIHSGTCVIPSYNLQVNVITNGGFGGLSGLFNTTTPVYLSTDSKELRVKPLPTEGKPGDFSGIVGELRLDASYSRYELNYGDSLALRAEVYGNCNLDSLKSLLPNGIPGFSVYETQKGTETSARGGVYSASKAFEAVLVPDSTGALVIEPVSISYFNPATEAYERAEIPGADINVLGEMPGYTGSGQGGGAEALRISQVSYAPVEEGFFTVTLTKNQVYAGAGGLGLLGVLITGLCVAIRSRKRHDPALRGLYRRLKGEQGLQEAYGLFNDMIKLRYGVSVKASTREAVAERLADTGLSRLTTEIMDLAEAPSKEGVEGRKLLAAKAREAYRRIRKDRGKARRGKA